MGGCSNKCSKQNKDDSFEAKKRSKTESRQLRGSTQYFNKSSLPKEDPESSQDKVMKPNASTIDSTKTDQQL